MALSRRFKKSLWVTLAAGGAAFVALQFVRPALPNPPVTADLAAPAPVAAVLRTACYDCHSNETKLLWFDRVVPAYWLVARDVRVGREHLNFSEIGKRTPAQQKAALYEAVNHIALGAMPPSQYLALHGDAKVTPAQLAILEDYLHLSSPTPTPAPPIGAPAPPAAPAPPVPTEPVAVPAAPKDVPPSPNGIAFMPDYKTWQAVSTTERFDNRTMRVIAGNDVAIRAIADGRVDPWPDGAAFAKISWAPSTSGQAAEFKQVELMVKDASKYADVEGWGWARWVGRDLAPYGKDAGFTRECTGCHAPMKKNDYVYTLPLKRTPGASDVFNTAASLPDGLPFNPLAWPVVTSTVDAATSTMTTVYASPTTARAGDGAFPPGSVLARVSWSERDDPHWFGARIPGAVKSVDVVTVGAGSDGARTVAYEQYTGAPLAKAPALEAAAAEARADALLALKTSPRP